MAKTKDKLVPRVLERDEWVIEADPKHKEPLIALLVIGNLAGARDEGRALRAQIERECMTRALVALGAVTIKTRQVSPGLKSIFAA